MARGGSILAGLLAWPALVLALLLGGCEREGRLAPTTNQAASAQAGAGDAGAPGSGGAPVHAAHPTVASLVPAVTDLLVAMGAGDHLVAISNYDVAQEGIGNLPRVGDYQSTDWERLSVVRPDVMVMDLAEDRVSQGFRKRAADLGIRLVNVHMDRLDDTFATMRTVGEVVGEAPKAQALQQKIRKQLDDVRQRVAHEAPVPTLIVLDEAGTGVAGPRNFLDDLLTIAGGVNLGATLGKDYPSIDRERLLELNPQAVVQLLPEARPQVVAQAQRVWENVPQLPAVKNGRVRIITDWYVLLPGSHVGTLAEQLADALHPSAATTEAVKP